MNGCVSIYLANAARGRHPKDVCGVREETFYVFMNGTRERIGSVNYERKNTNVLRNYKNTGT